MWFRRCGVCRLWDNYVGIDDITEPFLVRGTGGPAVVLTLIQRELLRLWRRARAQKTRRRVSRRSFLARAAGFPPLTAISARPPRGNELSDTRARSPTVGRNTWRRECNNAKGKCRGGGELGLASGPRARIGPGTGTFTRSWGYCPARAPSGQCLFRRAQVPVVLTATRRG